MMKVWIIWTHGTGKTTILNSVQPLFPEYNILKEVARDLFLEIGKTPQEMNKEELEKTQIEIYKRQVAWEEADDMFISDRTVYDNLAYASFVSKKANDEIMSSIMKTHKGYDKIFITKIEFPLEKDGIRFESDEFQKQVQDRILQILDIFQIEPILLTGSVWDRKNTFIREMKK